MRPKPAKLNGGRGHGVRSQGCGLAILLAVVALLPGCALLAGGEDRPRPVAQILDPESITATPSGRVFVTGRSGAYELANGAGAATLQSLTVTARVPAGCQFTGTESTGSWLFVLCTVGDGSYLLRGRIGTGTPKLDEAAHLPEIGIASGLTADDQGRLYIADSRHGGAAITRVTGAQSNEFELKSTAWLDSTRGGFPSGLQFADGKLYLTSAGRLSAIALDAEGLPGQITAITTRLTFLDDFEILPGGYFLMTDYSFNRLLLLSPAGIELGAFGHGAKGPTDVSLLPLGADGRATVLVTERDGERVSRLRVPEHLWRRLTASRQSGAGAE